MVQSYPRDVFCNPIDCIHPSDTVTRNIGINMVGGSITERPLPTAAYTLYRGTEQTLHQFGQQMGYYYMVYDSDSPVFNKAVFSKLVGSSIQVIASSFATSTLPTILEEKVIPWSILIKAHCRTHN